MAESAQLQTREQIEQAAERFEQELIRFTHHIGQAGIPNLHDGIRYALGIDQPDPCTRGKRIRPVLCLLSAETLGAPVERAMPFALAIELMHNFALVHDDIQDGDITRRGRESAWSRFGLPHAVNIGDYLLVATMTALTDWDAGDLRTDCRLQLVQLLSRALDHTHIGQALDMNARTRRDILVHDYLHIVREKTGFYLAAPIQGGALIAGADGATLQKLAETAFYLGPMFQIIDDIIDLTDGKGREDVGSDIREGKRSYLVAHTTQHCDPSERDRMFNILDKSREQTTQADIQDILELFRKHGAIEAGRAFCAQLHEQARTTLRTLPDPLADLLDRIFELLLQRKH